MDASTGVILGAIGGGVVAGGATLIVEIFKRKDDRDGVAAAIAGEISAIIGVTEKRGLQKYFEDLVPRLLGDSPPERPWLILDTTVEATPVMKAYLNRVGSLPGDLPRRVAHFYWLHRSVLTEIKVFTIEVNPKFAAARISRTLPIWYECKAEGLKLVDDLLALRGIQL